MPQQRLAVVGGFVIGGLLLFAVGLFYIGDRRMLFGDTVRIYAEFAEIAALTTGGNVRVAGMAAGEVDEILVPSSPAGRFRVGMRVRRDLHPLIRVDSIATIQTDGLVGNKFVQIQTGSEEAAQVVEEGTIRSREPFDIADLMQMMSDSIVTVNEMLVDVKVHLDEALLAVSDTAKDARVLMHEIGEEIQTILASTEKVTDDVIAIVHDVRQGRGTVGRLLTDDSLFVSAKAMATDAEAVVANVREASAEARRVVADFRGEAGKTGRLAADAQQTLQSARTAMSNLSQTTEALQRNFLVRGFFTRRGFFDLDDVTVAQHRGGALETGGRRGLRIWLADDVLFERDAAGRERLTAGGMARLDSAMSQFVRYTQRNPFVVEGYAQEITGDARYLVSRTRAQLVHEYLVGKFDLDVNYVTTMPMGADAPGSPAGELWSGVALAVFVPIAEL